MSFQLNVWSRRSEQTCSFEPHFSFYSNQIDETTEVIQGYFVGPKSTRAPGKRQGQKSRML